MAINWHDYYKFQPEDWFTEWLEEWNTALELNQMQRADVLVGEALGRGVWVDASDHFRHPNDPHKEHTIEEILRDDWIEY